MKVHLLDPCRKYKKLRNLNHVLTGRKSLSRVLASNQNQLLEIVVDLTRNKCEVANMNSSNLHSE